ncbi:MAG: DnaJ domain-containing protein [Caldilineaceae bacterium]|nr:DnaJ domain-containing protein [Caldilineaceae bacterium]
MPEKTHYEVLGVRTEASQSVIEAAYQRLKRQVETASTLERRRTGIIVTDDLRVDSIEEAYSVLRDLERRQRYDETLIARGKAVESMDLARTARQHSAEAGAWLSEQHYGEEEIRFRIGWAADFAAVRKSLEDQIPASGRRFDSDKGEWRVDARYGAILDDLFDNYAPPDRPPVPRQQAPIYQPQPYTPSKHRVREMWEGWPFLLMAGMAVALVITLLFPRPDERQLAIAATATAGARLAISQEFGPVDFPTPIPEDLALPMLPVTPIYPSVHLRAEPNTEAASFGYLYADQRYWAIGRTADSSWLLVMDAEQLGWSAAWTLTVEGDPNMLPSYAAADVMPELIPTPTATPAPSS